MPTILSPPPPGTAGPDCGRRAARETMKDWVEVPPAHEELWPRFAVAALEYLSAE
ncbi:hypothetical protein ACFQ9X_16030 [Catenulispora yoronensis]